MRYIIEKIITEVLPKIKSWLFSYDENGEQNYKKILKIKHKSLFIGVITFIFLFFLYLIWNGVFTNIYYHLRKFPVINAQNDRSEIDSFDRSVSEQLKQNIHNEHFFTCSEIRFYESDTWKNFFLYVFKFKKYHDILIVTIPNIYEPSGSKQTTNLYLIKDKNDCKTYRDMLSDVEKNTINISDFTSDNEKKFTERCSVVTNFILSKKEMSNVVTITIKMIGNPIPSLYSCIFLVNSQNDSDYIKSEANTLMKNIFNKNLRLNR